MSKTTFDQFDKVLAVCKEIFLAKMKDYGTAWRILRTSSLTDQIYIKASRIRSIQEKGESKVNEGIEPEFIGIINYSIMALIQLKLGTAEESRMDPVLAENLFETYACEARDLMGNKNHDYGEAWRQMRISSLTDIILMKLLRIKQIEDNDGVTVISEGLDANYLDIINYSVFALIQLEVVNS
ncbi:MAG: DUF1599 domain-containing protein [Bacteroidetes bacterium]|nr:DUF1599 domain-containing protein [Bacteroidota bacterium]